MKNKKLETGTNVFDVRLGWGIIADNNHSDEYMYRAIFGKTNVEYTSKGFDHYDDKKPLLSLTEYSLEKGGFTAIDSEPPLQKGELAYFWDNGRHNTILSVYESYDKGFHYSELGTNYDNASREIPKFLLDKQKEFNK